jgi:hypothetical protein
MVNFDEMHFAGRVNGLPPPPSRKGETLSGIVQIEAPIFFVIPARASLGRDDNPLAMLYPELAGAPDSRRAS